MNETTLAPRLTLVPLDRRLVASALGAAPDSLHSFEQCGSLVVRSTLWTGFDKRVRLSPAGPEGIAPLFPRIEFHHLSHQLRDRSLNRVPSLWEELFPYPISQVAGLYQPATSEAVRVEPPLLRYAFDELWNAFQSVERKLAEQELSCLWIRRSAADGGMELPIFFQYVRRRRVRSGFAANQDAWLNFLRASEGASGLSPGDLGLSVAVFAVTLETRTDWEDQLAHIADSLRFTSEAALGGPQRVALDTTGPALNL